MLSDEQLTKFQVLYKNRFGKEITKSEALEKGTRLIRLIELVYKPTIKSEHQETTDSKK